MRQLGRRRDSYLNCHFYSCRPLPRFSNVLTSFKEKYFLFTGDFRWEVGHSKRIKHLLIIYKKLLFIILIKFTSTQRFAKQIPISYLVSRAVFQPSFKPSPHGTVYFKIMRPNIVTKLANQNRLTLDRETTKIHFSKPSSACANLKLNCKPVFLSPEVLRIIPTTMFFA